MTVLTAQTPDTFPQADMSQELVNQMESVPKTQYHHELESSTVIGRKNISASKASPHNSLIRIPGNPLLNDFIMPCVTFTTSTTDASRALVLQHASQKKSFIKAQNDMPVSSVFAFKQDRDKPSPTKVPAPSR